MRDSGAELDGHGHGDFLNGTLDRRSSRIAAEPQHGGMASTAATDVAWRYSVRYEPGTEVSLSSRPFELER